MRRPEVEIIQVVKVTSNRGDGTTEDIREVTGYYTLDGLLIHESDPHVSRYYAVLERVEGDDLTFSAHTLPSGHLREHHGVMIEVEWPKP